MKLIIWNKIILAAGISIFAAAAFGDDMTPTNPPPTMFQTSISPADFAWDASLANLKEVRLGEVAEQNSTNEYVKKFGRRMVRDHSRANEKLIKIGAAEGLNLAATNTFYVPVTAPENEKLATELMTPATPEARMLAEQLNVQHLASLSGADFDQAYANEAVKDHTAAVQLFENASANLQDKKLKKFADKCLPILREHYRLAVKLQDKICGGMENTNAPSATPTTMPPTSM